jgi:hypothetical protein
MSPPRKPHEPVVESRINTSPKRRHHAQPFQYGLGTLFEEQAAVAVCMALAMWLMNSRDLAWLIFLMFFAIGLLHRVALIWELAWSLRTKNRV